MTNASADALRAAVAHARPGLLAHDAPHRHPAPGVWSPAQTLGHLVDSAMNNTGRIVRGSRGAPLVFARYDQDAWVEAGRYAEADWLALVALWQSLNEHLVRIVEGIPDDVLDRAHPSHPGHMAASYLDPPREATTLRHIVDDYTAHIRHHLRRLDPALVA